MERVNYTPTLAGLADKPIVCKPVSARYRPPISRWIREPAPLSMVDELGGDLGSEDVIMWRIFGNQEVNEPGLMGNVADSSRFVD